MHLHKTKSSGKKPLMVAVLVVAIILVLILILAGVYVFVLMDQITYDPGSETLSSSEVNAFLNEPIETADPTEEIVDPTDITWATEPASTLSSREVVTILLIGQDRRPDETVCRSDTMILCVLNKKTGSVTLASLMRDMYVPIPGYLNANRINASYAYGGMPLLKECIRHNLGVQVDGCVAVDFDGFVSLMELVGGVDIELNADEVEHLNKNEDHYGFPEESWELQVGMNHLTPHQALAYSRVRYIGAGDFGRTERQRKVLLALLEEAKSMSVTQLNSFLMTAAGLVTTDMSQAELLGYGFSVLPMLSDLQINGLRIPYGDYYQSKYVDGVGYVLIPDLNRNREVLASLYE